MKELVVVVTFCADGTVEVRGWGRWWEVERFGIARVGFEEVGVGIGDFHLFIIGIILFFINNFFFVIINFFCIKI